MDPAAHLQKPRTVLFIVSSIMFIYALNFAYELDIKEKILPLQ